MDNEIKKYMLNIVKIAEDYEIENIEPDYRKLRDNAEKLFHLSHEEIWRTREYVDTKTAR